MNKPNAPSVYQHMNAAALLDMVPSLLLSFCAKRFALDSLCKACGGKGKRGRGACGQCEGSGTVETGAASLDAPRIRFNWGYHDARADVRLDSVREVAMTGDHTTRRVSAAFSYWYAAGYERGLRSAAAETTSTDAWVTFSGREEV